MAQLREDAASSLVQRRSAVLPRVNIYRAMPPERKRVLPRLRLVDRLTTDGLSVPLTVLCADAGYGKTTLLCDFHRSTDAAVTWYRLDSTDRDLVQFGAYLTYAVETLTRADGEQPAVGEGAGITPTPAADLAFLLVRKLDALSPRPVAIVLDNFEKVNGSAPVRALIESLLEIIPQHCHLFITSREKPNLPLARLRADQRLLEIGPEDLALTAGEARDLVATIHGLELDDPQTKVLMDKTEGWVAGVAMAAQSLRYSSPEHLLASLEHLSGNSHGIYDYLAEEVFQQLPGDTQSFLLRTSVLSRLPVDVCNEMLEVSSARQAMIALEDAGLFTHSTGVRRTEFRYHRLFREYLLDRLSSSMSEEEIRNLHRQAARALEAHSYYSEAREQYALAGDHEAAANLIEQVAQEYLDRGMLETVGHWLSVTPESVTSTRPWLIALHGKALRRSNEGNAALPLLERAYRQFCESGDLAGQAWVAFEISFVHYMAGRYTQGAELAEMVLARIGDSPLDTARILSVLCLNRLGKSELQAAINAGEAAIRTLARVEPSRNVATVLARAHRFLAQAYSLQGNLDSGLQSVQRSLEVCRWANLGDYDFAWAEMWHGALLVYKGDLAGASAALDAAEGREIAAHRRLVARIAFWRAATLRDKGDLAKAEQAYLRAGEQAVVEHAFLRLREKRITDALHLAREGCRFFDGRDGPGKQAEARVTLSLVLEAYGDVEQARLHLARAVQTFREKGLNLHRASALLHLAALDLNNGREAEGVASLRDGLTIAEKFEFSHFLWWEPATFALLAARAVALDVQVERVSAVLRTRLLNTREPEIVALLNHPNAQVRDLVRRLLDETANLQPAEDSQIRGMLADCEDRYVGERMLEHIAKGNVTVDEVALFRGHYGLTWRELDVLCAYYLEPARSQTAACADRRSYARRLCVSENTLKAHIKSIRRKTGMARRGSIPQVDQPETEGAPSD